MKIGFAGAGNVAAAMARGRASIEGPPERRLICDAGSGRAADAFRGAARASPKKIRG